MKPLLSDLSGLTPEQQQELLELLEEEQRYQSRRLMYAMYPDRDGIWRGDNMKDFASGATLHARHKYQKHLEFFRAGATHRERCAICANRVGKTLGMGGYEVALHLTGDYPAWWDGYRFTRPTRGWACGNRNETTRDIVQTTLLGDVTNIGQRKAVTGTGMVPGDLIDQKTITWKQGVADLVDVVRVRHVSGGYSRLGLKSYEQGRKAFEGTAQDFVWDDEEPPEDVYGEQLIRTATTNGIVLITFTPLQGMSKVVKAFRTQDLQER